MQESALEMMDRLRREIYQRSGRDPRVHGFKYVVGPCSARQLVRDVRPMLTRRDVVMSTGADEIFRFQDIPVVVRVNTEQGMCHLMPPHDLPAATAADIDQAKEAWRHAARGQA